jgi:hypothetical protein
VRPGAIVGFGLAEGAAVELGDGDAGTRDEGKGGGVPDDSWNGALAEAARPVDCCAVFGCGDDPQPAAMTATASTAIAGALNGLKRRTMAATA